MRLLVIGGTRFVGRYIVEAALARGHDLTLLHRGQSGAGLFGDAEHLLADRDDAAALTTALAGRSFDGCVDVSAYVPRQVRMLAAALDGRGGHHVYVSSVSAYADPPGAGRGRVQPARRARRRGDRGDHRPDVRRTEGRLRTSRRRVVRRDRPHRDQADLRDRAVRPDRAVPRWVDRIRRGGDVLAPGPADAPIQVVDARDQAEVVVGLAEKARAGAFNTIGTATPYTFGELLDEVVAAVGPDGTRLAWADAGWLREQGVGGHHLPLWSEGETEYALAMSNAAALDAGMPVRPVADTTRDTLRWIDEVVAGGGSVYRHPPLPAEREQELLTGWLTGPGRG